MKNNYKLSSLLMVIYCFLLLLLLNSIPQGESRKLEQLDCPKVEGSAPSPTPVNTVGYRSITKNESYVGVVCVNGKPRSKSTTVHNENGTPGVEVKKHPGSSTTKVNDPSGKPDIAISNTPDAKTTVINGSDGKPTIQVTKYSNGTSIIYVLDDDGKPLYLVNGLPPGVTNFGDYAFAPPMTENPVSPPENTP